MSRLPQVSGNELIGALTRAGFEVAGQRGSHVKLRTAERVVIVPIHGSTPLRKGTLRAILRDAGIGVSEFVDLL